MGAKVLGIIDDDEIFRFTTEWSIKKASIKDLKVVSFENGEKAIDFFDQNIEQEDNLPDIIFLDINMPLLDGWEFLKEYRKRNKKINKPIHIFMSSSSISQDDIDKAKKQTGVSGYIVKPISTQGFIDLFNKLQQENKGFIIQD